MESRTRDVLCAVAQHAEFDEVAPSTQFLVRDNERSLDLEHDQTTMRH
jgi:hypothetical protein